MASAASIYDAAVPDEETALLMTDQNKKHHSPLLYSKADAADPTLHSNIDSDTEPSAYSRCLSQSWTDYNTAIEKHPLLVKSVTGLIILGLGDLSGQGVEHLRGTSTAISVDWPRAARFGAFGLFGAPWSHYYFYCLDTVLPPTPKPFTRTTAVKVFIDQFIQAPILLALMISSLSIMKGAGIDGVRNDMGSNYVRSLIANCKSQVEARD
jgi:hypothetical protein